MSTVQDFENAPVGATATKHAGLRAVKTDLSEWPWTSIIPGATWGSESYTPEDMSSQGFTLDPEPTPAPTTAREAFDLAWNLGHPVKEGQKIPADTKWMTRVGGNVQEATMRLDYTVTANDTYIIRTHEPLPEPEPGWLTAHAVLAAMNDCSEQKVWLPKSDGNWECTCCGVVRHWSKMTDVTPLWPKEDA